MELYLQFFINGIISGSIYALVASGFSVIYNTNKFMHFAHGHMVLLGGYIFYSLTLLNVPFVLAGLLAGFFLSIISIILFRLVYSRLQNKNASNVILLLSSIALLILIQNTIQIIYGGQVKVINLENNQIIEIAGAVITPVQIIIVSVCFALFFLLYLLLHRTILGKSMRAVANNSELAKIIGINEKRVKELSFIIGSFIAGIAGSLLALEQSLLPTVGVNLIIKGFTSAIIGGIDFVPASILGAYLLGIVENISIIYIPSEFKITISFGLLFLFLIFRPQGLLGQKASIKK